MVEPANEVRGRMGNFEIRLAYMEARIAELSVGIDRRDKPMERILRCRELTDQPH